MSENSTIEWTDHTFNPWEGCQKVGPGCDHCYAETRNARFGGGVAINWGPGAPRRRTSPANWHKPLAWNAAHAAFFAQHGRRQRVFCASLADVFDNAVPDDWRADLFELIAATPNLDWLLLTKRIGNVGNMLPVPFDFEKQYPNVWLGATITSQAEADRDIPKLLALDATVRFLSMEPLLGPVDLSIVACKPCPTSNGALSMDPSTGAYECCSRCDFTGIGDEWGIDWVIVGGESGPGARPMDPDWARSLRDQCAAADVPFLFKQWGEWAPNWFNDDAGIKIPGSEWIERMGKKLAGRMLDGLQHDGFPDE
jgi:protein gp37